MPYRAIGVCIGQCNIRNKIAGDVQQSVGIASIIFRIDDSLIEGHRATAPQSRLNIDDSLGPIGRRIVTLVEATQGILEEDTADERIARSMKQLKTVRDLPCFERCRETETRRPEQSRSASDERSLFRSSAQPGLT